MNATSPYISQQLSRYILNKAKEMHIQSLKLKVIQSLSKVEASKFPADCTLQMMQLFNSIPDSFETAPYIEEKLVNPSSYKRKHKFKYSSSTATPHIKKSSFQQHKGCERNSRGSYRARTLIKKQNICQPLLFREEEDEEIQTLRIKKQKLYNLQTYFKESQRDQKSKSNKADKYGKLHFTTDYNGDPLELRVSVKQNKKEPNLFVQIHPKIRQQKIQNLKCLTQQTHEGMVRIEMDNKDDSKPSPSKKADFVIDQKKQSKLIDKSEAITLKNLQSQAAAHLRQRRQKKPKQNTSELPSIAYIKCL